MLGPSGSYACGPTLRFYSKAVLSTAAKFDVRFSVTAGQDKRVRAAIEAIPDQAWQPIPNWLSTLQVSSADTSPKDQSVSARETNKIKVAMARRVSLGVG